MPSRSWPARVALAAALLPVVSVVVAAPAHAAPQTTVDVLRVVDGEYVVETVTVAAPQAEATADRLEDAPDVVVASPSVAYRVEGDPDWFWEDDDPQAASDVRSVWNRTRGEGQLVAVLDTAATLEHPDLAGAVLPGTDLASGPEDPWHGTGVAGIIAARADNGIGGAGMAPGARVMPVRVCGDGGCTSAAVARGILWAVDHGADVINMSLGGPGYSDVTAAAVQYALDKGISVVASAGNSGDLGNPVVYPAALSGVIAVSATDPAGAPATWAEHGWQADVATVGESVLVTAPGDGYGSASGTSFSGPAVAGAVALLRAAHPGIGTEEVQAALQAGADSASWDRAWGAGRLDVPAAMAAADRSAAARSVTPSPGAVAVNWPATAGASTYTVRVDGVVRATVSGTTATVTGLVDGNQVAVDVQPGTGERSRPVLATVGPPAPATPVLHSATLVGSNTLHLSASVTGTPGTWYTLVQDGLVVGSYGFPLGPTPTTVAVGLAAAPAHETRWQLRSVGTLGRTSPESNAVVAGTGRPAPPGAVTGLTATQDGDEVRLTWDDLGTAYTYRVSTDGTVLATPRTAGAVVPAPGAGLTRTWQVAVVDAWQQAGPAASVGLGVALPRPSAPAIGRVTEGNGQATVAWTASPEAGVTGYVVTAFRGSTAATTTTAPASATSAAVTGLTNGTTYRFTVAAVNAAGIGSASAPSAPATPHTAPSAPGIGRVTAGNGAVTVRWTAPSDSGGADVSWYAVRAYRGNEVTKTVTARGGSTSLTVTGLSNGTAYRFTVAAINAAGNSRQSAVSATVTPHTVPGKPSIGRPTVGNSAVTVRWAAPRDTGGAAITGYVVRAYRGSTVVKTATARAGRTSLTVSGLANGTGYRFTVAAVNAAGTGRQSPATATLTPRRR